LYLEFFYNVFIFHLLLVALKRWMWFSLKKNLFISYMENFNSHNQYLSYLLKHGILGFLLFVGAFVYYLRLGFKHRSFMYVAFLLLLLIGFYTENILDSNKGIVFFAFFNTFFGYLYLNKAKTEEN